jgi:hypothetical protein
LKARRNAQAHVPYPYPTDRSEPLNERDGILNGITDRGQRDSVIVKLQPGGGIEAKAMAG